MTEKPTYEELEKAESERKQAEEALRESETFLNATGQMAKVGGWEIDGKTKKVFWTKEIYNITEVPPDYDPSSLEKKAIVFFSPEDQLRLEKAIERAFEHNEPYDMELHITTAKGNKKWVHAMCEPFVVDGKAVKLGGTFQDITERKQAEEALKIANEKLLKEHNQRKILSKRLIELLEKDRHDVAMELHDSIGQTLTSLKLNLETIDHRFKPIDTELGAMIKVAEKRTIQAIREINNISHGLMPGMLDALGLLPSLRELFNEIQEHRGIKINFFNKNVPKRFDQAKELAIYRIVQEALTNIVKHAKAKNVFVNLSKRGNAIFLSVEDDGIGFDQEEAMKISKGKGPLGLIIMRERAIQLNGELTIESQVGKGTNLLMEMPI